LWRAETKKEAGMPKYRIKPRTTVLVGGGPAANGAVALVTYQWGLRPWHERRGASESEVNATLPGDELVPEAKLLRTKAGIIHEPVESVWP
jgi:putative SOS response-associated peptidase YedK